MLSIVLALECFLAFKNNPYSFFSCDKIDLYYLVRITRSGNPEISTDILKGEGRHTFLPSLRTIFTLVEVMASLRLYTSPPLEGKAEKPDKKIPGGWRPC